MLQEVNVSQLVLIDETWAKTNMTRTYGRSESGTRLFQQIPNGRWQRTNVCSHCTTSFIAPLTIDGPISAELFLAWVKQHLAPPLKQCDIVVMDNLSSHKVNGVRAAVESVGAQLRYLRPEPNQIGVFNVQKITPNGAERTIDQLWKICGSAFDQYAEAECRSYFKHCGYRYT